MWVTPKCEAWFLFMFGACYLCVQAWERVVRNSITFEVYFNIIDNNKNVIYCLNIIYTKDFSKVLNCFDDNEEP